MLQSKTNYIWMKSFSLHYFCVYPEHHNLLLKIVICIKKRRYQTTNVLDLRQSQINSLMINFCFLPHFLRGTKCVSYSWALHTSPENKKRNKIGFLPPYLTLTFFNAHDSLLIQRGSLFSQVKQPSTVLSQSCFCTDLSVQKLICMSNQVLLNQYTQYFYSFYVGFLHLNITTETPMFN